MRFLVDKGHLPVDVRAEGTLTTPLLALATRRCCFPEAGDASEHKHSCGLMPSPGQIGKCAPLRHMAALLLQLGADARACTVTGACLLAVAASAGAEGLWDPLTRLDPPIMPGVLDEVPAHAGRIVYGLVSAFLAGPTPELRGRPSDLRGLQWLRSQYQERQLLERWIAEVNAPVQRLLPAAKRAMPNGGTPPPALEDTNALLAALSAGSLARSGEAVQALLKAGVTLISMRLGREHFYLGATYQLSSLDDLISHAERRLGGVRDAGEVLVGVLTGSFSNRKENAPSDVIADAIEVLMEDGVSVLDPRWWPWQTAVVSGSGTECQMSPLECAILARCLPAVEAICRLMAGAPEGQGDLDALLPSGATYLETAAALGVPDICRVLIEHGASVMAPTSSGESALWTAIGSGGAEIENVFCEALRARAARGQEEQERLMRELQAPTGCGGCSLMQRALAHARFPILYKMNNMGIQLNQTCKASSPPLRIACNVRACPPLIMASLMGVTSENASTGACMHS